VLIFEDTAGVSRRKATQIHQYDLASVDQAAESHPPSLLATEEIVNPEAAVLIAFEVHLCQSQLKRLLAVDEAARESSADKVEEFMRFDGGSRKVGPSDHLDTADMTPMSISEMPASR
jgi:hypothetical protein